MDDAPEPSMQLLAEAAQNQSPLPDPQHRPLAEHDDRSSSLSDIEDRLATEGTDAVPDRSSQISEEEDTEAETERLEESPDKLRQRKQVLLSAANLVSNDTLPLIRKQNTMAGDEAKAGLNADSRDGPHSDPLYPTSPISSLDESAGEGSEGETATSNSSRKRKRGDDETTNESLKRAAMQLLVNQVGDDAAEKVQGSAEFVITSANGRQIVGSGELFEEHSGDSPRQHLKNQAEQEDAVESNDEDVDMEDAGVEADTSARNEEELIRKRTALDILGKIENDFALLRDRLFDERTRQLDEELASLESQTIAHPDYLLVVAAIEAQRKERVSSARTAFSFKVKALQNKSVAERTYYHSQYMQSVREVRDNSLERANQEWYQIQRGRRALDESAVDRNSLTAAKRHDLVAQQNAYNMEVSILSGMAKWVGFPAAPEVTGASQSEMDEDLRKMGISLQPQQSHVSSTISQYLRQSSAAERQFSKSNPWANAQHPQHPHNHNGPQHWNSARPGSPFTPAVQNNPAEPALPNGSASTIPALPSSEIATSNPRSYSRIPPEQFGETPSRPPLHTERESGFASFRPEEHLADRIIHEQVQMQSSPLDKGPPYLTTSESAPRALKSPDRRAMGMANEDAIGPRAENRLAPGFASHEKMPTEVRVGMA